MMEILGLIHYLQETFKIHIIVLADKEQFFNVGITPKYLSKFFIKELKINSVPLHEIVNEINIEDEIFKIEKQAYNGNTIQYNPNKIGRGSFTISLDFYEKNIEPNLLKFPNLEIQNIGEKVKGYLRNPRNIIKIMSEAILFSKILDNIYNPKNNPYFNAFGQYNKLVILAAIYKVIILNHFNKENIPINLFNNYWSINVNEIEKLETTEEKLFYTYFLYCISHHSFANNYIEKNLNLKIVRRLLTNDDEDIRIINELNEISGDKPISEKKVIFDFMDYQNYLDIQNNSNDIYNKMLKKYLPEPKNIDEILNELYKREESMKFDFEHYKKYENSLFNSLWMTPENINKFQSYYLYHFVHDVLNILDNLTIHVEELGKNWNNLDYTYILEFLTKVEGDSEYPCLDFVKKYKYDFSEASKDNIDYLERYFENMNNSTPLQ